MRDIAYTALFLALLVGGWFLLTEVAIAGSVGDFIREIQEASDYGC